ncbi:MAG: transglycosylase domain-containing protein [Clostridia bacterium]|nr:transglycosylase domain-containing protein [Clostridia bacterium]
MKTKKRAISALAIIIISVGGLFLLGLGGLYIYSKFAIDFDGDVELFSHSASFESTAFFADSDKTDDEYTPVQLEISGPLKKIHYSLDEICPYLKWGFIAVEDRKFYDHKGIDFKRTGAAAVNYVFGREHSFGGSTITQQVVKNISGDNDKKLTRKLNEIIRAVHLEQNYTKNEIFEVYLNVIPMGNNMYGVGIASRAYFGKEPSELNAAEAATLIGITNAPTMYSPYLNPDKCKTKRDTVLSVMYREGVITEKEYRDALSESVNVLPKGEGGDIYDSWFVETVIKEAAGELAKKKNISLSAAEHLLLGGGYKVYTTMDIGVQAALESYFENKENFPEEINSGLEYSMVITNSSDGTLAGIVGGAGEKRANRILNNALVPHTPGSVLKPIALYAPLIDEGKIRWSTVFDDVPVSFSETEEGYKAYPKNSPNVYQGLTTVKDALRLSKNTVAVRLCEMRGTSAVFYDLKNNFGFDTLIEKEKTADGRTLTDLAVSPLALGQLSYGVSLAKLTEAYSALSGRGMHKKMRSFLYITDGTGNIVLENNPEQKRIYKEASADIVTKMLEEVVNDGTAKSLTLDELVPTAGKTGTSGGGRDKMFIGYTPYYTAGIWCGFESSGKSVDGLNPTHLKIWDDIMWEIHKDKARDTAFETSGLIHRPYCVDSGELYSENCLLDVRGSRLEYGYFTPDNAPNSVCKTHVVCYFDSLEKGIATDNCPKENLVKISLLDIPNRKFPTEVHITDAEYVYRHLEAENDYPKTDNQPYFYYALPPDEYAGVSGERRQFNCACPTHK